MSTQASPVVAADSTRTLEQKLLDATTIASQAAAIFSPGVSLAIRSGVAVEPVISGFLSLIFGIFKHHATKA